MDFKLGLPEKFGLSISASVALARAPEPSKRSRQAEDHAFSIFAPASLVPYRG